MLSRFWKSVGDVFIIVKIAIVVAIPVCLLMFHIWNQYRITQLGYKVAQVTHQHRKLLDENKKLKIEAALLGRTGRMTALARARFGLQPMQPGQVIEVKLPAAADATAQRDGLDGTEHASLDF